MKINGFQKLTLLDYPGKVACTVFTGGCNFRCPFCHNSGLVLDFETIDDISEKEIIDYLQKRKKVLEGVCISGGEPLIQDDIENFIERIKQLGFFVKLDTNGSFPKKLNSLLEKKLIDYVAMDIKNSPDKYSDTSGVDLFDIEKIKKSAKILMSGVIPYEFRTTVVEEFHQQEDFIKIGKWLKGAKAYYLQYFVESDNNLKKHLHACNDDQMKKFIDILKPFIENTFLRGK